MSSRPVEAWFKGGGMSRALSRPGTTERDRYHSGEVIRQLEGPHWWLPARGLGTGTGSGQAEGLKGPDRRPRPEGWIRVGPSGAQAAPCNAVAALGCAPRHEETV